MDDRRRRIAGCGEMFLALVKIAVFLALMVGSVFVVVKTHEWLEYRFYEGWTAGILGYLLWGLPACVGAAYWYMIS